MEKKRPADHDFAPSFSLCSYDSGTLCDLNGQPREAVVKFQCSPSGRDGIKQITETATCAYTVDFESRELCKHPEFQAKTSNVHHIQCQPLNPVT